MLRALHADGFKIGLISNSQRSLASFQAHFELRRPVRGRHLVARSRLHEAAPEHLRGGRCAAPASAAHEAVMVGDSVPHDIEGALQPRHARRPGRALRAVGAALRPRCR